MTLTNAQRFAAVLIGAGMIAGLSGCTPTQENDVIEGLQTALTDLNQNRALTEQFVRDLKATADPQDPALTQAMDSYTDARDAYNRYLDVVESGVGPNDSRSLQHTSPREVENATADFLADATRVLKPSANTRRIAFQRAVVIPDNLQALLARLPKRARRNITDQLDDQVRWRSWGQL